MSSRVRPLAETYHEGISTGQTAVRQELAGLAQELNELGDRVEALAWKSDRNQAQIIKLLTQLVGQRPDAN